MNWADVGMGVAAMLPGNAVLVGVLVVGSVAAICRLAARFSRSGPR
jgi:hypothetical protein